MAISLQDLGTIAVSFGVVLLLWVFFQFTKVGLALRASAINPDEAGSWACASAGCSGWGGDWRRCSAPWPGILAAPSVFLDPNMMQAILIYAFAAAVLGGIDSPVGAVVGGLLLGVGSTCSASYVDFVGADLRLPAALLIILVVLLVKPSGLFGRPEVKRV